MDLKNCCIICGLKSKELTDRMCKVCKHLADEKFYIIENEFMARKYFKDYLHKVPGTKEREELHKLFTTKPTTEWIHGIMPSKCPFCNNMSTNRGIIQSIKVGSPHYKKIIEKEETPKLVCKACGDLSLYLNHIYNFSREQSVEILKHITKLKEKNKKENLICCQICAKGLGNKETYKKISRTEAEREAMKLHTKKYVCGDCLKNLKNGKPKNPIQADK